jgi:Leucine-rich repeat (LRR) protein
MHDVVRSFAHDMTKDEGLLISEWQDVNRTLTTTKLRHLSISDKAVEWDALQNQDSLKTLMLFGSTTVDLKLLWNNLSCLRVLYLDNLNLHELPDSMGHLKHLRYLCLCGTRVSKIPQSIGDIKFLEAIKLCRCTNISQLPNSILIWSRWWGFQLIQMIAHMAGAAWKS